MLMLTEDGVGRILLVFWYFEFMKMCVGHKIMLLKQLLYKNDFFTAELIPKNGREGHRLKR